MSMARNATTPIYYRVEIGVVCVNTTLAPPPLGHHLLLFRRAQKAPASQEHFLITRLVIWFDELVRVAEEEGIGLHL
jgi:hypothetical protein